jgi:hypothetical protein
MRSSSPPCRPADNPFASHRVESLAFRHDRLTVSELCRRIVELGGRVEIVGPEGSGKTTLLHELTTELPGEPVTICIGGGDPHPWSSVRDQLPRPVRSSHAVLVDGSEQLGPLGWRLLLRATRHAQCLVATLHQPGRLPTLIECRTDEALLRDLVSRLTAQQMPDLDDLYWRHEGNIRLCFRELYDLFAGRPAAA